MEQFGSVINQIRLRVWFAVVLLQLPIGIGCMWLLYNSRLSLFLAVILYVLVALVSAGIISALASYWAGLPLRALGNAILHASPGQNPAGAPNTANLKVGHAYVTAMAYQLYQIASLQDNKELAEHKREATQASNILTRLPLPLFVFNKQQVITFASDSALSYIGTESAALFGTSIFEAMDLEFQNEFTLESWIADCQANKVTDTAYWHRVRIRHRDDAQTVRQCDLAGYYNRDNPSGIEFIITMFDRSEEYSADDDSLSFIALAVHELRTPLTLMRGLIEVFEDELEGKLDDELSTFMRRLKGSAKQLSSFVTNILNVAKIEGNQLVVKLTEQSWPDIIKQAVADMEIKAKPLGKTFVLTIDEKLPTVAADRLTSYEVVCNLLDNAIKYSGQSKQITITVQKTKDDLIETTVADQGAGIPSSVLPTLFEKFHRSHRTRNQVGGTGLGLYLSKAIIGAHGGDIWVKSKEGQGTTFGFTLQPYASLADSLKSGDNEDGMVRTAHGWIKNHSLYRR